MPSVPLAFLFGFAAQRGSLCAVSAIHTMIERRSFGPFLSFLRCSAWVILVSLPAWWLLSAVHVGEIYAVRPAGLAGAALFGAGAAINGGCTFGTLTRFATGDASFAMTVIGAALGVWIERKIFGAPGLSPIGPTILAHPGAATITLVAVVTPWCVTGLAASGNEARPRCWEHLAPMVMGVTGGMLYLIDGSWAYTLDIGRLVSAPATGMVPEHALLVITLSAGVGAAAAAWASGNFHLRLKMAVLPHRLSGGILMGFGAVLVPGGNAVLILRGIPTFSPHAVPDYLALCLGILVLLRTSKRLRTFARLPGHPQTR
jgi:hypothetical protein